MPPIKIAKEHFHGAGKLYGNEGLSAVIRNLAIDNARLKLQVDAVPDLTDNSTGADSGALVEIAIPEASFDATTAGGAQLTAFNAALVKLENAGAVLAETINLAHARLGLPALTAATGTVALANTIPAQDRTVATANGASATDYASGRRSLVAAKQNVQRLAWAVNTVLVALGEEPLTTQIKPVQVTGANLVAIPAATASATGASALAKTVADAALGSIADDLAHIAVVWNAKLQQSAGAPTNLNVIAV